MNTFGGSQKKALVLLGRLLRDGVGSGVEPEEPVEAAVSIEGELNVFFDLVQGQGQVGSRRLFHLVELDQGVVAGPKPGLPQGLGDEYAFVAKGDISSNAHEVPTISVVGESGCLLLAFESRNGAQDGVERIASGGEADGLLRVEEVKPLKGFVKDLADHGVLASHLSLAGLLLALSSLLELLAGLFDLLGRGLVLAVDMISTRERPPAFSLFR